MVNSQQPYSALLGLVLRQPEAMLPTPFPNSFVIDFVTNFTSSEAVLMNSGNPVLVDDEHHHHNNNEYDYDDEVNDDEDYEVDEDDFLLDGTLYYDWDKKSQRIDHAAGSYECVHFYNTNSPCSLYFLPTGGMYRVIHHPDNIVHKDDTDYDDYEEKLDCCLDLPDVGTPPPNWASSNLVNATYDGIVMDEFSELLAHQWSFDHSKEGGYNVRRGGRGGGQQQQHHDDTLLVEPSSGNGHVYNYHTTREVAFGPYKSKPLGFSFPGNAMGRQDYHYLFDTMEEIPNDDSLFELPSYCLNRLCPQTRPKIVTTMVDDPMQLW